MVFTVIGLVPAVDSDIYRKNAEEISAWEGLLNTRYGGQHVCFEQHQEDQMRLDERLAYFAASTFMLLTVTP